MEFPFGGDKNVLKLIWCWLHNSINILKPTEVYIFSLIYELYLNKAFFFLRLKKMHHGFCNQKVRILFFLAVPHGL